MAEINNVSTVNKFELSDTLLTISNNRLQQSELSLFPAQFYVATYNTLTSSTITLSPISLYDTTYITEINNQLYFNGLKWRVEKSTAQTPMFASKKIMLNRYSKLNILNGTKRLQSLEANNPSAPVITNDPNVEMYEPTHIPVKANDIIFLHECQRFLGAYGYRGSQVTDYALFARNIPVILTTDDIIAPFPIKFGVIKYSYDFDLDLIDYTSATIVPERDKTSGVISGAFAYSSWTYYNTKYYYSSGYYNSNEDDLNFYEDTYLCQGFIYLKTPELFIPYSSLFGYYIKDGKNNIKQKTLVYENYPINGWTRTQIQNLVTNPEALANYA